MSKRHFGLPYPHCNVYKDGRREYVTVYQPARGHRGQPNATTAESAVTCRRCRAYLGLGDHRASPHRYLTRAIEQYASDVINIDDDARLSYADHGAWVQAWVWVADPKPEENTP
jgi:hypothetical protein